MALAHRLLQFPNGVLLEAAALAPKRHAYLNTGRRAKRQFFILVDDVEPFSMFN